MLTKLTETDSKVVGIKQTLKALKGDLVEELFIAEDADRKITLPLVEIAQKNYTPIHYVKTMGELGQAAGIEVGASVVAILKQCS